MDTIGQDSRQGCSLLKARGLCHVGPGGSDIRDISFKGLELISKPYVEDEEETQGKGEDGELEPLRNNAIALSEQTREPE
ncbi:hypothetical protein AAC387_Pa04g1278 [Persea americana]